VDPPVSFGTILVRWYAGMGPNPCGGFGIYSVLPKNPWVGTHPGPIPGTHFWVTFWIIFGPKLIQFLGLGPRILAKKVIQKWSKKWSQTWSPGVRTQMSKNRKLKSIL